MKRSGRSKKRKKNRRILFIILIVVLIGIGIYGSNLIFSFSKALDNVYHSMKTSSKRDEEISIQKDPFSILILGIDETENDAGRSDTMIVMTINPKQESIKMLSIPRDTRTEIIGNGTTEKINHAYARGGVEMSIATVEHLLDIPIDYFLTVNMDGFKDIINVLDGVTVMNDMDLSYKKYDFPKGEVNLNGKEALIFSRIRYEDPRGDFGRQMRQKQIIEAILNKGSSVKSVFKYDDVFDALGENVKTNLTFKEMVGLYNKYKGIEKNIELLQFEKFNGGKIGKYWYFFPDEDELSELQIKLKKHLQIANS